MSCLTSSVCLAPYSKTVFVLFFPIRAFCSLGFIRHSQQLFGKWSLLCLHYKPAVRLERICSCSGCGGLWGPGKWNSCACFCFCCFVCTGGVIKKEASLELKGKTSLIYICGLPWFTNKYSEDANEKSGIGCWYYWVYVELVLSF